MLFHDFRFPAVVCRTIGASGWTIILPANDSDVCALISDDQPNVKQPIWPRNNVKDLANKICELAELS